MLMFTRHAETISIPACDHFHRTGNRIHFALKSANPIHLQTLCSDPPGRHRQGPEHLSAVLFSFYYAWSTEKPAPVISRRNTRITLMLPRLLQRQVLSPEATPPPTAATKILSASNPFSSDLSGNSLSSLAEGHSSPYQTITLSPCWLEWGEQYRTIH